MKTFLGIKMTKKQKMLLLAGIPVGLICLLFYLILAFFEKEAEIPVSMPNGGLSSSIFDSQNQTYKSESAFQARHTFLHVPYTIDTVEGQKVMVGNGSVYEHAPYYFYYSELAPDADIVEVLKEELSSVLLFRAKPQHTKVEVLHKEQGFVNGCSAIFYMLRITATDGENLQTKYMALYRLHLDPSVYETEWEMLVGCMSQDYSTEGFLALQTLSYSSIGSLKLDEKAQKRIEAEP